MIDLGTYLDQMLKRVNLKKIMLNHYSYYSRMTLCNLKCLY